MIVGVTMLIISFLYLLLTGIMYYSKEKIINKENRIYNTLIITSFCGVILELSCIVLVPIRNSLPILNFIVNRLFLIYLLTWITLFTIYIFTISFANDKKLSLIYQQNISKIKTISLILYIICMILLIILPLNYYYDGKYVYSYGIATTFLYIINFIAIFLWFVCLALNIKEVGYKKYIPLFTFAIGGVINLIVRFFNPGILLITVTQTFITIMMYYTIENPDLKMLNELKLARMREKEANKVKSEFLSSMSHEIRTPLNGIAGLGQVISMTDSIEEIKEYADDVVYSTNVFLNMFDELQNILKLEANEIEKDNRNYNLYEEIDKVLNLFNDMMKQKGLILNKNIPSNIPILYGSIDIIKRVLINVIDNAVKYTNKGTIDFEIKLENIKNKYKLTFIVKDTGRGISEENMKHLFDEFERGEHKDSAINGLGLGLSIAKGLLNVIDGEIELDSTLNVGTTVKIKLIQERKVKNESVNSR